MVEFITKTSGNLLKVAFAETKINYNVLSRKLKEKQFLVDGARVGSNILVSAGQKVVIFANMVSFKTIFENEDFLIVLKPRGILSTSEGSGEQSVEMLLNANAKQNMFYACHRLDANTEGLLCFAKNKQALESFKTAVKNESIEKIYYAEVFGRVDFKEKTITCYLQKDAKASVVKIVDEKVKNALKTITKVEKVAQNGEISLLKVTIYEGKTHQIRVALSSIGLYIVGDDKYGNRALNKKYKVQKQQLFAAELRVKESAKLAGLSGKTVKYEPKLKFNKLGKEV